MIDPGLKDKVVLITGGNNPFGIGAAIARAFASQGAQVFIHYFRQATDLPDLGHSQDPHSQDPHPQDPYPQDPYPQDPYPQDPYPQDPHPQEWEQEPGLDFYNAQQRKTADEVVASIREMGVDAASWEGDLRQAETADRLFEQVEKTFGKVDILVNNAADYVADTFLPLDSSGAEGEVWEGGPSTMTVDVDSHDRHFSVNTRAAAILMARFAGRIIERGANWGRIINISADCAWGCPKEISYRASKYALESYSRSAAAELGPFGITVNVVSPGPVQSGYIDPELEQALIPDIPMHRVGRPEDIANAVVFFGSQQAGWITGQVLFVHGGHRMALGQ